VIQQYGKKWKSLSFWLSPCNRACGSEILGLYLVVSKILNEHTRPDQFLAHNLARLEGRRIRHSSGARYCACPLEGRGCALLPTRSFVQTETAVQLFGTAGVHVVPKTSTPNIELTHFVERVHAAALAFRGESQRPRLTPNIGNSGASPRFGKGREKGGSTRRAQTLLPLFCYVPVSRVDSVSSGISASSISRTSNK